MWYESPLNVALALRSLNSLKIPWGQGYRTTLKCSFGTSKYCLNFLKESECESGESSCPFLHYLERRRDKVIQDDIEFREFISSQDKIVDKFEATVKLKQVGGKQEFYNPKNQNSFLTQGFPSLSFIYGKSLDTIQTKIGGTRTTKCKLANIPFLTVPHSSMRTENLQVPKTSKIVEIPCVEAVSVKICIMKD